MKSSNVKFMIGSNVNSRGFLDEVREFVGKNILNEFIFFCFFDWFFNKKLWYLY